MSASIYRVEDPLENFKIRLRVRELSRLQVPHENPSERMDQAFTVNWQQKIYSPWEIEDYVKHKNSSDGSEKDVANRKRLHRMDTPKQPVTALLEPSMLFTYVDSDGYSAPDKKNVLATYLEDNKESYVAAAMRPHVPDSDLDGRQARVRQRVNRDRTCKTMHICLATDVNTRAADKQEKATEHLLCTIHLYSDGMLEVSPDFSDLLEEPPKGSAGTEQAAVPGMFATDKTAATAMKKGLRLSTYSLRSASGSDFEYTIENVNGVFTPTEVDALRRRVEENDLARALKLHGPRGPDSNWQQDPPKESFTHTVTMNVELVSATGFDGRELFVSYEVVCPDNWDLRTGNLNDGVASEDSGSEKSFSEQDEEEDILFGRTQLATAHDSYYSPQYSQTPGGGADIGLLMPTENVIWGSLFFVITSIAVLLGPGFGFWVVPAVVVIVVLGTGTPGGNSCEVVNLSEQDRMDMSWGGKYDLHKSSNAPAFSLPVENAGGLVTQPVATFGHPIGMSFDVRDGDFESGLAPSAAYPVVLVEVYSTQYLGGNTLEGYGYMPLQGSAGYKDVSVSTWRPVGSRHSRLMEFFVGGNPVLQHPIFAEVPNKMASSLSRFGVLSEGSGSVRFRINTTITDPREKEALREKLQQGQDIPAGKTLGRRSVDDIVNHFKQVEAMNRSMSKSGIFTASALSAMGKSTDLSSSRRREAEPLSSAARAEKVSQILNRARSRVATLTKDDSSAAPTRARPREFSGGKKLKIPAVEDGDKNDEPEESTPLLGRPPIRKIHSRGDSGELERTSTVPKRRSKPGAESDDVDMWDSYETPIRVRRASPAPNESPLDSVVSVRNGMDGVQSPAEEGGTDASEAEPLLSTPQPLGGNARVRQFQREKSLSGGVGEAAEDSFGTPELKPLRPIRSGQKFSNPKRGQINT